MLNYAPRSAKRLQVRTLIQKEEMARFSGQVLKYEKERGAESIVCRIAEECTEEQEHHSHAGAMLVTIDVMVMTTKELGEALEQAYMAGQRNSMRFGILSPKGRA